jgi:hypothetical protein
MGILISTLAIVSVAVLSLQYRSYRKTINGKAE